MTEFIRNFDRKMPVDPECPVLIRMRCGAQSAKPQAAKDFEWRHRRDARGAPHQGDITEWARA